MYCRDLLWASGLNLALEMPVAQLRAVPMLDIALRRATVLQGSFIRSKERPGVWGMLDLYHSVLILHLHVELPPKPPCSTSAISPGVDLLQQLFHVALYGDPVGSGHWPAVISSQLR